MEPTPLVDRQSSVEAKIRLFRSLFRAARMSIRVVSGTANRAGPAARPACANEWVRIAASARNPTTRYGRRGDVENVVGCPLLPAAGMCHGGLVAVGICWYLRSSRWMTRNSTSCSPCSTRCGSVRLESVRTPPRTPGQMIGKSALWVAKQKRRLLQGGERATHRE